MAFGFFLFLRCFSTIFFQRQDLVAVIAGMMRPTLDQVHIKVIMNKEDMDSFVMCVATKKTAVHFSKEMADLVRKFEATFWVFQGDKFKIWH